MWYVGAGGQMRAGFMWGRLKEGDSLEKEGEIRRVTPKWIFKKIDGTA